MGKQSEKDNPEEKARRKLGKAQLKLHVAQEEHAQARERGKQEVEKARLRAGKRLAKVAQRVERRAQAVARAEARLLSVAGSGQGRGTDANGSAPSSPEAAAEALEQVEVRGGAGHRQGAVVLPEGVTATSETPGEGDDRQV